MIPLTWAVAACLCSAIAAALAGVMVAGARLRRLHRIVTRLRARVARRDAAAAAIRQRFAISLEASLVTVFNQDDALVYRWISQGFGEFAEADIIGRTDADLVPPAAAASLETMKRAVLASGEPARTELRIEGAQGPAFYDLVIAPTRGADGTIDGIIGGAVDISERKQFDAHVRLLMRELTHRSKNLLAVIQALMRQTANNAESIQDFSHRFAARLESVAAAHDLLIKDDWRGTTMGELVAAQLAQYTDRQGSQISWSGPTLRLPADATQNIGMALHELATNAAKYGALSNAHGQVDVQWVITRDPQGASSCRIDWRESGGPPVGPPGRRGFGQVVIERTVARAVNGTVTLSYNPAGLEWCLQFPMRA